MKFIDIDSKASGEDLYLANSATMHTILKDEKYFANITLGEAKVDTISDTTNLIEGSGIA